MENEKNRPGLSGTIRELRAELGASKADLARMLGVSQQLVEKWEADPTREQINKMIEICRERGLLRLAAELDGSSPGDSAAVTGDCLAYLRFKAYEPVTSRGKNFKAVILDTIAAYANGNPEKDLGLF